MRKIPFVILLLITLLATASVFSQDFTCPPGLYWSRETVACEQETCPSGSGRNYTLECMCAEGTTGRYEEHTDPATGGTYNLLAACETPRTGILGWWGQQSTGVKVAIVAGGAAILIGGAIAAGLVTWAGVSALAGATAASLSSLGAFAGEFVAAWAGKKAMKEVAQRLARQAGKYLAKKLGRRATAQELKQLMLQMINQQLIKRGLSEWGMAQLDTLLFGIDLLW
ncbi:MAG TPA: hypothetical protein VJ123_04345 [Anaerolineales bacterium]|nr:hypothetical protein [Anaerolineales bacterium]